MTNKQQVPRLTAAELKRRIPDVAKVASDVYGIKFRSGVARCPFPGNHNHGDRNPSLRHDRKKQRLFCASQVCFGEKGSDAIALVQIMDRCTVPDAIKKLADWYGVSAVRSGAQSPTPSAASRSAATSEAPGDEKGVPAEEVRRWLQRQGYHAVAEYPFGVGLRKVRFEHETQRQEDKNRPEKTFRWEHVADEAWYSGDGCRPKPLYLNQLFHERDQVGLAVGFEGEAKADVAGTLGFAGFSFKDITTEQAAELANCDVVLWPDSDGSGQQQADRAAALLSAAGQVRSLKILASPPELPSGGDIIDAVTENGWDRERVTLFLETANTYSPPDASSAESDEASGLAAEKEPAHFPFFVSDDGVWFLKKNDDTVVPIWLASRIDVVAITRDGAGENWGRLLRWQDREKGKHEWAMPMEALATEQGAVRARLLSEGLPFITTNAQFRERFSEYIQTAPVEKMIRCVPRVGWHRDTYVLPDGAFGPPGGEEILYQPPYEAFHCWKTSGRLRDWQEQVGLFCRGNSRLLLAASCGLAGPILRLVGAESGGVHLYGPTSTGKTSALIVGGSVCGGGGAAGFAQTWRTTINGLEATAEAHNDGTLFLDELAQVDPRDAAETAYLLANGQGKSRMTRTLAARKKPQWNMLFVSSGELTLAEHASTVGKQVKGGVEVRLINIEADAGQGLGVFENLHDVESSEKLVDQLKAAAQRFYGTPIRAFLGRLVIDRCAAEGRVRALREAFIRDHVPQGSTGEVTRVAGRLAVIAAAGELATEWGITGWGPGEATDAAKECFLNWLGRRGTTGATDVEAGVKQVRAFIATHGSSRFQALHPSRANDSDQIPVVRDRVGFRQWNAESEETEYLIFQDAFKDEVCKGQSHRAVLKELFKREYLRREEPNLTIKPNLPELGRVRVYCIRATILEGSDAGQP
jgi:uncharacterized protein (DUF927 family)